LIAVYLIVVSAVYGLLRWLAPEVADSLVGLVVLLLLVPSVFMEHHWLRGRDDT
jgi:putative effector of murein hydrolase LrgA (UPF0299 family)